MPETVKNILVIRLSSLGDVVLTTAVLPNVKMKWTGARVTVVTKAPYAAVFERNPNVDEVFIFDPRDPSRSFSSVAAKVKERKWDVVIDLHANLRSWFLRLLAGGAQTAVVDKQSIARHLLVYTKWRLPTLNRSVRERALDTLRVLDAPVVTDETQLFPAPAEKVLVSYEIPSGLSLIGIAPGARHATKKWPAEKFAEAANRLGAAPNTLIVILGDRMDQRAAEEVASRLNVRHLNLTGRTSLSDLIAIISRLSFLLTNDSGLMHVGEALRVPLLALFGPTVRAFGFAPYRKTSRVAEVVNLPCRPCTLHGNDRCPLGHHKCMEDIDVNAVLFAASELADFVNKGTA